MQKEILRKLDLYGVSNKYLMISFVKSYGSKKGTANEIWFTFDEKKHTKSPFDFIVKIKYGMTRSIKVTGPIKACLGILFRVIGYVFLGNTRHQSSQSFLAHCNAVYRELVPGY